MGVKGLTTFVRNRSEHCMKSYELHDTDLVIDGDAVLCELYMSYTHDRNASFGGDYDKFAFTIYDFFKILDECNITPYIVLDGGYESRKMKTMLKRFQQRLPQFEDLTPDTQENSNCFPLFIRETFEDIVVKERIKLVRCDFEGDREAASIAKSMKCPVMSNDSDFFIFDVPYIPFSSFKMKIHGSQYKYIECEIFSIDRLIKCIGYFDKHKLHLLSALIGNDFYQGVDFSKIGLKKDNTNGRGILHRIEVLISWLQKETYHSALKKILNAYKNPEQAQIKMEIENAVNSYTLIDSRYLNYLREDLLRESDNRKKMNVYEYNTYEKLIPAIPKPFIENFRRSLYPTRFLDIFTQNKYYNFRPQVEISNMEHTHTDCLNIMSAVHKILTGSSENLVCLVRIKKDIGEQILPICQLNLPNFTDIQKMNLQKRQKTVLEILEIETTFITKDLFLFPESWYLFMLAIKYMIDRSVISWPLVYSVIMCKITVGYMDPQIGFFRRIVDFDGKFFKKISHMLGNVGKRGKRVTNILKIDLSDITHDEALLAMSQLIPYFEAGFFNNIQFDRHIVHVMSKFQSVLLHIKNLNQLLNMPFEDFLISECFNGTFIYNFTKDLVQQSKLDDYIEHGLRHSPVVSNCFRLIIDTLRKKKDRYIVLDNW